MRSLYIYGTAMNAERVALELKAWAQEKHLIQTDCLVTLPAVDDVREEIFGSTAMNALSEGILRHRTMTGIAFNNATNEVIVFTQKVVPVKERKILPNAIAQAVSIKYVHGGIAQAGAPPSGGVQAPYVLRNTAYTCGGSVHPARFTGAGTLGCLVKDASGTMFGLSNNHVTGMCSYSLDGEKILAPGHVDITANGIDPFTIGYHHTAMPMVHGNPDNVDILLNRDAALIRIADVARVSSMQGDNYDTPAQAFGIFPGQRVEKVGRTTRHTSGVVIGQMAGPHPCTYNLPGVGSPTAFFDPVYVIKGDNGPFSEGGDSGSLVTAMIGDQRFAVGLIFAGDTQGLSYALPLLPILTTLNVELIHNHNL